jgi:hypothetical protein
VRLISNAAHSAILYQNVNRQLSIVHFFVSVFCPSQHTTSLKTTIKAIHHISTEKECHQEGDKELVDEGIQ